MMILNPYRFVNVPQTLPNIGDNNALFNDECSTTAGWTANSGSPSITTDGNEVIMNGASVSMRTLTGVSVASNDWLVYFKLRVQRGANRFAGFNINNGPTVLLAINFGFDWVTTTAVDGTISVFANGGATKKVLATSDNYDTTPPEFVVHVDRDRSAIMIYRKVSGRWKFITDVTYFAGITGFDRVIIDNSSTATEAGIDYVTLARPNVVAIGDSLCAGANGFDPNPSVYGGDDNSDSTWMTWATIYQSLRNNLIVNKGIGSQSSTQLLARIAEATAHSPRVVFVHASSNDFSLSVSQATRTTNIQDTVNAVNTAAAQAVILNAAYPNSNHASGPAITAYDLDWWTNYRPTLTGVALAIDIMQPVISGGVMDPAVTDADGIHPTVAGYQAIGEYIATFE